MALYYELMGMTVITFPLLYLLKQSLDPFEVLNGKSIPAADRLVTEGKHLAFIKGKNCWRRVDPIRFKHLFCLLGKGQLVEDCHFRMQLAHQSIYLRKLIARLAIFLREIHQNMLALL